MTILGERVIRFRVDFGSAKEDTQKVSKQFDDIASSADKAQGTIQKAIGLFAKFAAVAATAAAGFVGIRLLLNTDLWTKFAGVVSKSVDLLTKFVSGTAGFEKVKDLFEKLNVTVSNLARALTEKAIAAWEKFKVSASGTGKVLEEVYHKFELIEFGALGLAGPLGKLTMSLSTVGGVSGIAALGLGALGAPFAGLAAKISAFSLGAVAAIQAVIFAIGKLIQASGNKLAEAANSWLETGIEFEKQQFGLEIAVRGFQKATKDFSISADDLVGKIRRISAETGIAAQEIKQGVNVMFEMSRVTNLTGNQIDTLISSMADFATVRGVSFLEVVYAIDQGFRGWYQSANALGLTLDDNSVKMADAQHNWSATATSANDLTQSTLRYKTALEQMSFAQGAAAESADKILAGAMRKLQGEINLMHGLLGQGVTQFWLPFYQILGRTASLINTSLGDSMLKFIGQLTAVAGVALQTIGFMIKWVSIIVSATAAFGIFKIVVGSFGAAVGILGSVISSLTLGVAALSATHFPLLANMLTNVGARVTALTTGVGSFSSVLLKVGTTIASFVTSSITGLLSAIAPILVKFAVWTAVIYLTIEGFKYLERETGILSETFALFKEIFTSAFSNVQLLDFFKDRLKELTSIFSVALIIGVNAFAVVLGGLAGIFLVLAQAIDGVIYRFKAFSGMLSEEDTQRFEERAQRYEIALSKLGGFIENTAVRTWDQLTKVVEESGRSIGNASGSTSEAIRDMQNATAEAGKRAAETLGDILYKRIQLNQQQVEAAQNASKLARETDRLNVAQTLELDLYKDFLTKNKQLLTANDQDFTLVGRLVQLKIDQQRQEQLNALQNFERLLGMEEKFEKERIGIAIRAIPKDLITEKERQDLLTKSLQEFETKRVRIVKDAAQSRRDAELNVRSQIATVQGNVPASIQLDRERNLLNINYDLEKKLEDIKMSNIRVEQRSAEAVKEANAKIIGVEINTYNARKQMILDLYEKKKSAVNELIDLEYSTADEYYKLMGQQYTAESVNFDRRRDLAKLEVQERILQVREMSVSAADKEHFITLAFQKESAIRRKIILEEAAARKRAIAEAAGASRSASPFFNEKSDLEIIQDNDLRRITPEENKQISEEKVNRELGKQIERIRTPLSRFSLVAIDELNKIQDEYNKIQQGYRAALDGQKISSERASFEIGAVNQVFSQRLMEAGGKFSGSQDIFRNAAANLPGGVQSRESLEEPSQRAQRMQTEVTQLNTQALMDLTKELQILSGKTQADVSGSPTSAKNLGIDANTFNQKVNGEPSLASMLDNRVNLEALVNSRQGFINAAKAGQPVDFSAMPQLPPQLKMQMPELNIMNGLDMAPAKVQQVISDINNLLKEGVGQWENTLAENMSEKVARVWKKKLEDVIMAS